MNQSSLFIFNENWKFRQWLLLLVINTENLTSKMPKKLRKQSFALTETINPANFAATQKDNDKADKNDENEISGDDSLKTMTNTSDSFDENLESTPGLNEVYHLNNIKIVNNKIITTKSNIKFSKWFEYFIIIIIILNSLALILDNPLEDPNGWLSITLSYFDIFFTIVFTIEAIMKIIALGFFYNRMPGISGYILNGWNLLDFIIVIASLVDLGFTFSQSGQDTGSLKSLKALRAFRALRPLRFISRNEGLQIVINTLFASIPAMTNVFLVMMLLLLIFAIMGVNFFKGTFYQCELDSNISDSTRNSILEGIKTKED